MYGSYDDAEISSEIMNANDMLILKPVSEHAHYVTFFVVHNLKVESLESRLINLVSCYFIIGFNFVVILVDMKIKFLKDHIKVGVLINWL